MIRHLCGGDASSVARIWQDCALAGEVVYKPATPELLGAWVLDRPDFDPELAFVWDENGVKGFIIGGVDKEFLPGQTPENTPGYLTILLVERSARGRGVGTALLSALETALASRGKERVRCTSTNPVNLPWLVPGGSGHDHNNAPGCDVDCPGYGFLLARGYQDLHRETAMYLNLTDYRWDPAVDELREQLRAQGIQTGRYDPAQNCDFDRMCSRVGSEYWRKVLREETAQPHPRPILAATHQGYMVGFTGPVDRQESGRGFFTGICTDPEYERRGIATVLFNLLMTEFQKVGADFSTLFTGVDNHAQRLYARTGFRGVRTFAIMDKELN